MQHRGHKPMRVFDIFRSIQGEGTRAGVPMDFVRLAGCDLACAYCDTPAARDPAAGCDMTVAEVLAALPQPGLECVEITGGEPMLHLEETNALIAALVELPAPDVCAAGPGEGPCMRSHRRVEAKRTVLVETSGAHPIELLDGRAVRIVDFKTPGSGMAERMVWTNVGHLTPHDEAKFVLTGRDDYEWARAMLTRHRLADLCPVLFSPVTATLDARTLAQWIVADALPVRLNLQLHRLLNLP